MIVYSTIYSGSDERKTSKLRVTGLCVGNSPATGEFPTQRASNAENGSTLWRRNGNGGVSKHQPHHCLLNCLFGCRSKKTSKLPITGPCAGNSQGTGEFPAQMASNAENVSIWWRHHVWWRHHAGESYGVSIMSMLEKIDRLISAPPGSRILIIVYLVHQKYGRQHFQIQGFFFNKNIVISLKCVSPVPQTHQ